MTLEQATAGHPTTLHDLSVKELMPSLNPKNNHRPYLA